jgi:hypothetical protein
MERPMDMALQGGARFPQSKRKSLSRWRRLLRRRFGYRHRLPPESVQWHQWVFPIEEVRPSPLGRLA